MSTQKGFTLLETVVTLVIVSLIVAVLMQALGQALAMRTRILHFQREARVASLQQQWFRDSIEGAIADIPEALGALNGHRDGLEFVSAAPLGGAGLERARWVLDPVEGGVSLHYRDKVVGDIEVVRGPLRNASFDYLDRRGDWHAEWNAEAGAAELMPRLVRFRAHAATTDIEWIAPVAVDPAPPLLIKVEETPLAP